MKIWIVPDFSQTSNEELLKCFYEILKEMAKRFKFKPE